MELEEKKEKNSNFKILFGIIGILVILLIALFIFKLNNHKTISSSGNKEVSYDNYIYKIRYDFGTESYIYLLPDNVIKTVEIQEIYDIVPDCNCMEPTGEFNYDEETINFSEETKKAVISVFDELYQKSGKKEFNADNMELTKYQQRILLATILNFEDQITIENNLTYEKNNEELNSKNNDCKIVNSKMILNNSTENESVNKIANYLNELINNDFDEVNTDSKEIIENTDIKENLGVNLKLELVYTGPYSLSFIYTTEGQLGASAIYNVKGYTFHYTGDIHEFDMNGWKDKYYKEALNNFMKTDLYINYKDQLNKDWESIIYDNMYLTGNWYLSDEKLEFLIPAYLLGFDESIAKIIDIDVKIDEEF